MSDNTDIKLTAHEKRLWNHALATTLGHTFEVLWDRSYDLIKTFQWFLHSSQRELYFEDGSVFSQAHGYIATIFEETMTADGVQADCQTGEHLPGDKAVAYWMGYLIAQYLRSDCPNENLTDERAEWLYYNYEVLHTQSIEYVEELIVENSFSEKIFSKYPS